MFLTASRFVLVSFLLVLAACGAQPAPAIQPGPPIPGLNLSGKWYSQEFGDVQLVHSGKRVTGTYADPRGPDHNGTIRAELEGDLLRVEWIKPGNPVAAVMSSRGKAWLRVKAGGNVMEGRWGFADDNANGGAWVLEKSQYK